MTSVLFAATVSLLLQASSSDVEPRTSDLGPRTSDLGRRTSDLGPRTSDIGHPPSDIAHRSTSDASPQPALGTEVRLEPARASVQQLTYAQLDGSRNAATLVTPGTTSNAPKPAILFLHWYEPPRPTSNRTEFLPEAVELAGSGVVSLLIDTPWSNEQWFARRDAAKDYEFTVQMEKDVRRALDVLLAQPGIDKSRVAVVGHDFGAMWGSLAVAADPRVSHFVYMAGTRSFTDWYLFTPRKEGAEKDAFVAKLAPLDPIAHLARISPRPILLQFGTKDPFVKNEAATAMADAVTGPKTVKIYEFEHELTFQARLDRIAWLKEQFRIK